jgi:hypothetical protein
MASIAEWINKIKTAIYGEEVRGAIWQSLEAMNTEVEAINVDGDQIQTNKTNIAANTAAITALNSRIANVYFKQLTSNDQKSVSFSMSGRATILAIGNDNGSRSWMAVINVTNNNTGSMVMIKENSNPEYNPTATFSSGKTVTLAVHEWENIVLISTGSFV